jgi:hypothetical protein
MSSKNTTNSTPSKDLGAKDPKAASNNQSKTDLPSAKDAKGQPTQPGKDAGKSTQNVQVLDPKQEEMMKKKTGTIQQPFIIF